MTLQARVDACHDPRHPGAGARWRISQGARTAITGWAIDSNRNLSPSRLRFLIDGKPVLKEMSFVERPDVSTYFESRALIRCGFSAVLHTENLEVGDHRLQIAADFGDEEGWSPAVEVGALRVEGCDTLDIPVAFIGAMASLDSILVDSELRPNRVYVQVDRGQTIVVAGWAVDELNDAVPDAVFVELDSGQRFDATIGVQRSDVAAQFLNAKYVFCGYSCEISTVALIPETYRAELLVVLRGKSFAQKTFIRFEFTVK